MKLVKFTNSTVTHLGNPIFINPDHIAAVYEASVVPGGSLKTFIFGGHGVLWEVEESLAEVTKLINNTSAKLCECK